MKAFLFALALMFSGSLTAHAVPQWGCDMESGGWICNGPTSCGFNYCPTQSDGTQNPDSSCWGYARPGEEVNLTNHGSDCRGYSGGDAYLESI